MADMFETVTVFGIIKPLIFDLPDPLSLLTHRRSSAKALHRRIPSPENRLM